MASITLLRFYVCLLRIYVYIYNANKLLSQHKIICFIPEHPLFEFETRTGCATHSICDGTVASHQNAPHRQAPPFDNQTPDIAGIAARSHPACRVAGVAHLCTIVARWTVARYANAMRAERAARCTGANATRWPRCECVGYEHKVWRIAIDEMHGRVACCDSELWRSVRELKCSIAL